jgi:hypothetical protein
VTSYSDFANFGFHKGGFSMNADEMDETFNASLDAAYEKALPVINERIAAYQRDVASGELDDDSTTKVSNEPNQGSESKTEPESPIDPHLPFDEQQPSATVVAEESILTDNEIPF